MLRMTIWKLQLSKKQRRLFLLLTVFSASFTFFMCTVLNYNTLVKRNILKVFDSQVHAEEHSRCCEACKNQPIVWVRTRSKKPTHLSHVHSVFRRLGFQIQNYTDDEGRTKDWNILWSHNYPFRDLRSVIKKLKPYQKLNHVPGSGFITNKVSLVKTGLPFIPKAFQMPHETSKLLLYAKEYPDKMFVQKSNDHRGIKIEPISGLDLESDGLFVQEFIHNPLLVDGHKFDIGVYTAITSINPLRVYVYEGEVLFRFCPDKYLPFDAAVKDKYVVGDDYLPVWKVDAMKSYYSNGGYSMRDSFSAWLKSEGKDPAIVWSGVRNAIREVFFSKESTFLKFTSDYPSYHGFFEMMRFDFIITSDLKVYLMEANMSPNLSSAHYKENKLLYEQVIFNLLSLVGVALTRSRHSHEEAEEDMKTAMKDIAVFPEHCAKNCLLQKDGNSICYKTECQLCRDCVSSKLKRSLHLAHLEHVWKGSFRRVFPPSVDPLEANSPLNMSTYSPESTLMTEWFRGKCLQNSFFCS